MYDDIHDIRVVIAIELGTNYSGFAYALKSNSEEVVIQDWNRHDGLKKVPTIISYENDSYTTVKSWGFSALTEIPRKSKKSTTFTFSPAVTLKPIELFKLHSLGESLKEEPLLPDGLDFRIVIRDYIGRLGASVEAKLGGKWKNLDFYNQVLIVFTVPGESNDEAIAIIRECALNSDWLKDKFSNDHLMVMTESDAAAVNFLNLIVKRNKLIPGDSFMIVDCGADTVDLTTYELLEDAKLNELTERTRGQCGSSYIDQAFINLIGKKIGASAIKSIKNNHYGVLKRIVLDFCEEAKQPFSGKREDFEPYEVDLVDFIELSVLRQYVEGEETDGTERTDWSIEVRFEEIKEMFDVIIDKIIRLIREQLDKSNGECSIIFLIGGFSESDYLQARIKREFGEMGLNISVPTNPTSIVLKGAVLHGLKGGEPVISKRTDLGSDDGSSSERLRDDYERYKRNYLHDENLELKAQLKVMSEQFEKSLETLNSENQKLRNDCKQYQNDLSKKSNENDKLEEVFKGYEDDLAILRTENIMIKEEQEDQSEKYEETLATLRAEVKELKDELEKKTDECLVMHNENDELKARIERTEETLASSRTENKNLNKKLADESKKSSRLNLDFKDEIKQTQKKYFEDVSQLKRDMSQYKENNAILSNELSRRESEIQELQYKNEEYANSFNDLLQQKEDEKQELITKNTILKSEASQYQSALGNATNTKTNDNFAQLKDDILALQDMLKNYITSLKGNFEIDFTAVKELMKQYNINIKITPKKPNKMLIKSVLQYHILNSIIEGADKFFDKNKDSESVLHLEAEIASKSKELVERLVYFSDTRKRTDATAQIASIKIRKEVNAVLNNQGFSDILDGNNVSKEHYFINYYKNILNKEMNKYRIIKDATLKQRIEELAPNIIREFVRIVRFRLNIQEPRAQMKWVPMNTRVDSNIMVGCWDEDDVDNLMVEICSFPLIGQDLEDIKNRKVYAHAQVFAKRKTYVRSTKGTKGTWSTLSDTELEPDEFSSSSSSESDSN